MWCWAFVLCCVILKPNVEGFTKTVTVCQNGMLTLACPVPMSIISANYGRLDYTTCPGSCIPSQLNTNTCRAWNSLSIVSGICNGLLNCSVFVGTNPFGDPCNGILKYLTVTYSCPVTTSTGVVCGSGTLSIQCPTGFIYVWTSNYGRLDSCTCATAFAPGSFELSNTSCTAANSLSVVNNACNGQTNCSVSTSAFGADPCYGIGKYLTVTYSCIAISTKVACENSTLAIQCVSGTIVIQSANFGRLDTTVCMGIYTTGSQQLNTTSCTSPNSLNIVNSTCNGQQNCSIPATVAAFGGDPCSGITKYLTVTFYCQVASTSNPTTCPSAPTNATICPTTTTTSTTSTTTPTSTTSASTTRTSAMSTTSSKSTTPTTSSSTITSTTSATATSSTPLTTTTQENTSPTTALLSSSLATAMEQSVVATVTSQFGSSLKVESTIATTTEYGSKWLIGTLVATVASVAIACCCWIAIAIVITKTRPKVQSH